MQFGHPGYALSLEPVPRDNCRKVPVVNVDVISSSQDGSARAGKAPKNLSLTSSDLDGGWIDGADRYG